jgi:CHAT domain-containing protein
VAGRGAIWTVTLIVFVISAGMAHSAQISPDASPVSGARCAAAQDITLDPRSTWTCEIALTADQAWVVRVDQRDGDIELTILDAQDEELLVIDAPTRRATTELALIQPRATGKHRVSIRSMEPAARVRRATLTIMPLNRGSKDPVFMALGDITRTAAPEARQSPENAERSIQQLRGALAQLRKSGDVEYPVEVLLRITAASYWIKLDWAGAAASATEAMAAASSANEPVQHSQAAILRAASLIEIASAMKETGRRAGALPGQSQFEEVKKLLEAAARRFQDAGMPYDRAQAVNFLGIALFYEGDYGRARSHFAEAARGFDDLDESTSAALPLQNIAMIDYDGGDYSRAVDSYQSLLRVLSPAGDRGQYLSVLLNLGHAQYVMGDYEQALHSFVRAFEMSGDRAFTPEQARSLHGLGQVYLAIGERERAATFLEQALELRRGIVKQDPRGLQTSRMWVGDLKRENGDVRGALDLHLEALDNSLTVTEKARALYSIGRDHEAGAALPAAIQAYESALKLELPQDWPIRVSVMGAYGRAKLRSGDVEGRNLCLKAAQLHESRGDDDLAAQNFLTLADDDRARARFDAALVNVEKALKLFESQGLRAVNPDLRATYLSNRASAFEMQGDLYATLWQEAATPEKKRRLQDLALVAFDANRQQMLEDFRELAGPLPASGTQKAAATDVTTLDTQIAAKRHRLALVMEQPNPSAEKIDALRSDIGLLRTRLDLAQARNDQTSAATPKRRILTSSAALQSALSPDAVLLVYQLGENRSWLWSITREAVALHELAARSEIESAVRFLYGTWSTPVSTTSSLVPEMSASRRIFGSVMPTLRAKHAVTIVPDGNLRSLPFGALLLDAGAGERLAQTHTVILRSTLNLELPAGALPSTTEVGNRILLVGDPTVASKPNDTRSELLTDPWSWQPLPRTRQEILTIADIASDWRSYVLLGAEATKPALLSMPLDTFRTIHFATHARLDVQDPQLSSIALSSREANFATSASTLTVREILSFPLHAETVVLSACEASLGKSYGGKFSFGLSEAFLLAGARNVLGSLWRVSDESAQEYMRHFYEGYVRHDESPAVAAQAAAQALSRAPAFSHPYYGAAFVVTQR